MDEDNRLAVEIASRNFKRLQLPDINANRSVSGSGDLVSFENKMIGGPDGSAADGAARKPWRQRILAKEARRVWPGMGGPAFVKFDSIKSPKQ